MKAVLPVIATFLLASLIPVAARAQDDADYKNWMKQVDKVNASLRKELKAKTGDAATDDANKLAGIFAQVGQFWQKRSTDEAIKFAADSASGFKQVAELSAAGKFEEASAALKSNEANCSGCHKLHRAITIHGSEIK